MNCYETFQNILPAPVVALSVDGKEGIYVAPDSVAFVEGIGSDYTDYFDTIKFDWKSLAGAQIISINEQDAWDYVGHIADTGTSIISISLHIVLKCNA